MAVCNLFNELDRSSGNFMMFSQYVEDITRSHTEDQNYKVVPSRFVALDINYNDINIPSTGNLNVDLPKYFQNYFENGCAYGRNNEEMTVWNSMRSRNLFWNSMIDMFIDNNAINPDVAINEALIDFENSVKYWGDINLQSYNEHNGMGFNELYCYIPSNAGRYKCQIEGGYKDDRNYVQNNSQTLEGRSSMLLGEYSSYPYNRYFYDEDFIMSFNDEYLASGDGIISDVSYNINTIVVLYDIMHKENDVWVNTYQYIPMGMYIAGKFDDNNQLSNTITKFVNTSYDIGTSYGLRICTRFTVSPLQKGQIALQEYEVTLDSDNYAAINQLITAMGEGLNKMTEVASASVNTLQQCKDSLASIKNNRVNVPYVKTINGVDYWFVNGRLVSSVIAYDSCCSELPPSVVESQLNNTSYNPPYNNTCDCEELTKDEIESVLGSPSSDSENGTPGDTDDDTNVECNHQVATDEEVKTIFEQYFTI